MDHYKADLGGQATFCGGHNIPPLIWPVCFSKGLSTLEVQEFITKNSKQHFFKD